MNNSKTVMFLCDYQAVYGGNFVPSLVALEDALRDRGINTVYVFPDEAKSRFWYEHLKNADKCVETFSKGKYRYQTLNNIQRLITKHQITILHTHFISPLITEIISYRNARIKVVAHIHSDFSCESRSVRLKIRNFCSFRIFSGKLYFLSVSKKYVEFNPHRVEWLPNALATNRIPCKRTGAEIVRENNGVNPNEILLEIFAWSPYVKGLDIAVNAVKQINEEGQPIKLAIICGRQMVPEKMRDWIRKHTLCTGEEAYLLFWEPTEDVFSYHEAADILISASRSEGFSYAVLEMLSLGKRCVISDIQGLFWAKEYRQTAFFISEDIESCVEAIKKALNLRQNDQNMRKAVLEKYSIDKWIETIIRAYKIDEQ